jgi:hypothetical protein
MEAGKMAIEPIRFDLGAAAEEVAELLAPRTGCSIRSGWVRSLTG